MQTWSPVVIGKGISKLVTVYLCGLRNLNRESASMGGKYALLVKAGI